jgi:predicted dehydrogenase
MDKQQGEEMVRAMELAGLKLFIGFTYRFSPAAGEIRRLVRDGAIGTVRSLRLVNIWDCHGKFATRQPGETRLNERRVGRMLEGGPMVDCGVHQIDLARWWTGSEIVSFHGFGAWVDDAGYEAPDHVWVQMDHADGAHSMIESSFTYGHTTDASRPHYVFEAIGSNGVVRYCVDEKRFELRQPAGVTLLPWHEAKNFHAMYAQFRTALETGEAGPLASGRDGIIATHIAEQATRQAIANRAHVPL